MYSALELPALLLHQAESDLHTKTVQNSDKNEMEYCCHTFYKKTGDEITYDTAHLLPVHSDSLHNRD